LTARHITTTSELELPRFGGRSAVGQAAIVSERYLLSNSAGDR
jgi:hypothetical protein